MNEKYEPYGEAWEHEMMKLTKKELVGFILQRLRNYLSRPIAQACQACGAPLVGDPQPTGQDGCDHEWIRLHEHPAAFECAKCRALRR